MRILSKLFMLVFISALADARIAVDVFYEALCPYCRQFITTQLLRIMQTELAPELALRLYPYGNAHTDANGVTECQVKKTLRQCASVMCLLIFIFLVCNTDPAWSGRVRIEPIRGTQ